MNIIWSKSSYVSKVADCIYPASVIWISEVGCGNVDGGTKTCVSVVDDGIRCSDTCPDGQALSGDVPLYQTCSMYGMWDESVKYTVYVYPQCSGSYIHLIFIYSMN